MPKGGPQSQKYREAPDLYASGLPVQSVADFYGITRQAMWDILKRRGVAFRPMRRSWTANHFHRGGIRADTRAQHLAQRAIEKGVLVRPALCQGCCQEPTPYVDGRSGLQAHHDDYNKPLAVRWLCKLCHDAWHREHKATKSRSKRRSRGSCSGGRSKD
jgi:hypothetical protein